MTRPYRPTPIKRRVVDKVEDVPEEYPQDVEKGFLWRKDESFLHRHELSTITVIGLTEGMHVRSALVRGDACGRVLVRQDRGR